MAPDHSSSERLARSRVFAICHARTRSKRLQFGYSSEGAFYQVWGTPGTPHQKAPDFGAIGRQT